MARKTVAQKLRDEVAEVRKNLRYSNEENTKLKAKLERFEDDDSDRRVNMVRKQENLENQVQWLRNLVEKLAINPQVQELSVNQNLSIQKMHLEEERTRRR